MKRDVPVEGRESGPGLPPMRGTARARVRSFVLRPDHVPVVVALVLGALVGVLGWRGADYPAQLFRIDLFRQVGMTLWNAQWYGGHYALSYSVLLPPLGALLGPVVVGVACAVTATFCFDRLVRGTGLASSRRLQAASVIFAAGTVTNVIVGRLPFALGLAIGLAALLAGQRGHRTLTVVLTVLCPLASPVAGAFLALAWVAWGLSERRAVGLGLGAVTLVPIVTLALLFPEGGSFPFTPTAVVLTVAISLAVMVLVPPQVRSVRIGAGLYVVATLAAAFLATPMGGNVVRLGMFFAAPLLVAFAPRRAVVFAALPVLVWWQWWPALDGMVSSHADPSTTEAYYDPLVNYLDSQGADVERVEIPFTMHHFEAAYVAPHVAMARGWERQLDIKYNPIFYDPGLTSDRYLAWLRDAGVTYVALADAPLDYSAEAEAAILDHPVAGLTLAWSNAHWRVWQVVDAPGLVEGPATIVALEPDAVRLQVSGPGDILLRVRWSTHWRLDGPGCIAPAEGDWIRLSGLATGFVELRSTLVGSWLSGEDEPSCPAPSPAPGPRQGDQVTQLSTNGATYLNR